MEFGNDESELGGVGGLQQGAGVETVEELPRVLTGHIVGQDKLFNAIHELKSTRQPVVRVDISVMAI